MKENTNKLQFRRFGSNKILPLLAFVFSVIFHTFSIAQNDVTFKLNAKSMEVIERNLENAKDVPKLSKEELEHFKKSVENKINELQNNIIIVGSKDEKDEIRMLAIESCLKLFIPDAKMQVSNKKTGKVKTYLMEKYFHRLMSLPYTKVVIKFYDIAYVGNFYKGTDGRFHATATIFQEFKGYYGDDEEYIDKVSKTIDIILEYAEDEFFKTKRWTVKLGNIKVHETK